MVHDPNAGQTDDVDAVKVLTQILDGWHHEDMVRTDPDVLATDILVELPRRGWHLVRILTAEEFEARYAARSGTTVDQLRALGRVVRPCSCGEAGCERWQSVSREHAAEMDAEAGDS